MVGFSSCVISELAGIVQASLFNLEKNLSLSVDYQLMCPCGLNIHMNHILCLCIAAQEVYTIICLCIAPRSR